jgi:hypothetical protein
MKIIYSLLLSIPVSLLTYSIFILSQLSDSLLAFNGICPAAPTDIPAYPCAFGEFLERSLFSIWAITVHITLYPFWFLGHLILTYILFRIFWKSKK